jgi:hypothetical protein
MLDRAFSNTFGGGEYPRGNADLDDVPNDVNYAKQYAHEKDNYKTIYPKMARATNFDIPIESNSEDVAMTDSKNINSVILQPKAQPEGEEPAVLELWICFSTTLNLKADIEVNIKYVANGITWLNKTVKSTSSKNEDKSKVTIEGMYDTSTTIGEIEDTPNTPWMFDYPIYDEFTQNPQKQYVATTGETSAKIPTLKAYDGTDLPNTSAWENPYGVTQNLGTLGTILSYDAGNNYIEISFIITNKQIRDGSVYSPYDGDIPLSIGFMDPIF